MNRSISIWESCYQNHEDNSRPENAGAAASAASSPSRRAQTSPPVPNPWDVFTHQGKPHRILRMLPGTFPGEPLEPHPPVTARIHTMTGTPVVQGYATARTPHLVHVV